MLHVNTVGDRQHTSGLIENLQELEVFANAMGTEIKYTTNWEEEGHLQTAPSVHIRGVAPGGNRQVCDFFVHIGQWVYWVTPVYQYDDAIVDTATAATTAAADLDGQQTTG